MWENVKTLFVGYLGDGILWCLFLIALVFLFFHEKSKVNRILFVYTPVILLLVFFNPLFVDVVYGVIGEQIYYRILWLIPAGMVFSDVVAQVYTLLQGNRRTIFLTVCGILVMLTGKLIYTNPQYSIADNLYHIPDEVAEICDAVEVEGREVVVAFPEEMVQYVRQYSPYICMPYGREVLVPKWKSTNELHEAMTATVTEVSEISCLAKQQGCQYIVVDAIRERNGDFSEFGYENVLVVGKYEVWKDVELVSDL